MTGPSATSKPSQPAPRHAAPPPASIGWVGAVLTLASNRRRRCHSAIVTALTTGWQQQYDPMGHWWLSTTHRFAAGHRSARRPRVRSRQGALCRARRTGDGAADCHLGFHMPARMAGATAVYGMAYGLFPIGWIVLNVIFLYQLTVEAGRFEVLKHSLTGITQDRRLQLLLIAFSFGAFFEGAAGFGTPVAVTAALADRTGLQAAAGIWIVADRQHRAGGVRRIGHAHHRVGRGYRLQRDSPWARWLDAFCRFSPCSCRSG